MKYRVKVINPKVKKEAIVVDWHEISEIFTTVDELKQRLYDTFGNQLPKVSSIDEFNIGYFHGRPQVKSWIVTQADLQCMYSEEVLLWCDGKNQDTNKRIRTLSINEDELKTADKHSTNAVSRCREELEENISKSWRQSMQKNMIMGNIGYGRE